VSSILVVDDEHSFREAVCEYLAAKGHQVTQSETIRDGREQLAKNPIDILLVDLMLPDGNGLELLDAPALAATQRTIVITGHSAMKSAITNLQGPNLHYLEKPVDPEALAELCVLESPTQDQRPARQTDRHFGCLIGESAAMQTIYDQIRMVAPTDSPVFVTGESGTGKELVAQAIHAASECTGTLEPVNCGALTKELVASELFGHEKGSFTGANQRHLGAFERAAAGTLFLDEITEMAIDQQPHLLRALESREITRVGGEEQIAVSARVVSASNQDLAEAVASGKLREDLYYRLNVFPISLPPLRERRDDIALLVSEFLQDFNEKYHRNLNISKDALVKFTAWDWPGNVRELRHAVHRCVIATPAESSELAIPDQFESLKPTADPQPASSDKTLREIERDVILQTLKRYRGNRKDSAEALGISPKTLYNRLEEYRNAGDTEFDELD